MADKYYIGKRVGLVFGLLALVVSFIVIYLCWSNPPMTVIVLRHAEKGTNPTNDDLVPLTGEGETRARVLADALDMSGVSKIYVTQKLRTEQTAAPLATNRGIDLIRYNYNSNPNDDTDIDDLLNNKVLTHENRGQVVVIVGHSDKVPKIVEKLSGGETVTVGEFEFDNLFVLKIGTLADDRTLIKATYGAPR